MNIANVLTKTYKTELNCQANNEGHWLLKDNLGGGILYSQSKTLTGAEVLDQITDMQRHIDRLTVAQARLIALIEE